MYTSPYNCFVCPTANTKTCLSKNYDECPQKAPFMFIFCLRWKRKRKRIPQFFPCLRRTKCVPHFFVFFARGKKCGTRQKSRDALHATSLARWLLGKTAVSSRKCWARATARQLIAYCTQNEGSGTKYESMSELNNNIATRIHSTAAWEFLLFPQLATSWLLTTDYQYSGWLLFGVRTECTLVMNTEEGHTCCLK